MVYSLDWRGGRFQFSFAVINTSPTQNKVAGVVFSTKYRRRTISEQIRERLYEYVGGIIRGKNGHLIEIGGVEDHVHLLVNLSPAESVSASVRDIKANSSKWFNELTDDSLRFEWQKGYGAFTVSYSHTEEVRRYIQRQAEHHRAKTFETEYFELLKRHNIQFEPKFLFEDEHHG